jgi:hypothetical protein
VYRRLAQPLEICSALKERSILDAARRRGVRRKWIVLINYAGLVGFLRLSLWDGLRLHGGWGIRIRTSLLTY